MYHGKTCERIVSPAETVMQHEAVKLRAPVNLRKQRTTRIDAAQMTRRIRGFIAFGTDIAIAKLLRNNVPVPMDMNPGLRLVGC